MRVWMTVALGLALALPIEAGIEYTARTWQEGDQQNREAEMTVHARVDGDRARIEFRESGNPWMSEGSYLLTTDAGQTLYLVDPAEKTYGEFDLDAIMEMLGAFAESGLIDFEIENPEVETLASGPGKTVAGLPTRHARYRTSYDMRVKVMGFKRMQRMESIQDVWYTDAVSDPGMAVWLRKEPPRTGTDLDKLIDLETQKIQGFPLESVQQLVTTGKRGKQSTTVTRTQVTELKQGASFAAEIFEIPPDYEAVQMMPTEESLAGGGEQSAEGEAEEDEQEGGLLGRFKRFGKKKDG